MKLKRQITIETHSITIIRTTGAPTNTFCGTCRTLVSTYGFEEIADALHLSSPEIEALRQNGELHAVASNNQLVCGNSLADVLRRINQ